MRIIDVQVTNFGSYKDLHLEIKNQGLTLVSGPTGAGKSTLCDIVPWVLFGKTAKDGNADEVISWNADGPTEGEVHLDLGGHGVVIVRKRGKNANDLYWIEANVRDNPRRGKDLSDTQSLINRLLGMDYYLFMSSSYFHEFSPTGTFFQTTAKNRRQLTEQLVDLSLAKKLAEETATTRKELRDILTKYNTDRQVKEGMQARTKGMLLGQVENEKAWNTDNLIKITELASLSETFVKDQEAEQIEVLIKHDRHKHLLQQTVKDVEGEIVTDSYFEELRAKIAQLKDQDLDETCKECGNPKNSHKKLILVKAENELRLAETTNDHKKSRLVAALQNLDRHLLQVDVIKKQYTVKTNPYESKLQNIRDLVNPHSSIIASLKEDLTALTDDIYLLNLDISGFQSDLDDLRLLSDIIEEFRGLLVKSTIRELEDSTNRLLTEFFDSEIRVMFEIEEADKLDVTLLKDGNTCFYTQLSKGQRQLLKLCFSVSVMKTVSNHHGISTNALFFDEAFDGLDDTLKLKAFNLLSQLNSGVSVNNESIFVVEHNEALKTMFPNEIRVSLTNGTSAAWQS